MDHFPPSDWVDFVRGVLPPSQSALMNTHLAQGCRECLKTSATWNLVLDLSAREASRQPPADAVHIAKAAYVPAQPERWLPTVAEFARLIFDSSRQTSAAMVRSHLPSSRLFLHEAEPFTIDLRLDSDPLRQRISLMGQVLNSKEPEEHTNRIDVVLLSGERTVKKTSANSAGEFDLEFTPENNLQLFINIRGQRAIGIVLPDMNIAADAAEAGS